MILREGQLLDRVEKNFYRLVELARNEIGGRRGEQYVLMILMLGFDIDGPLGCYLGFMRAPAAKRNHHAREGGLVEHLLEMWDLWQSIRCIRLEFYEEKQLSNANMLEAIILHDLEKVETFKLICADPWRVEFEKTADLVLTPKPLRVVEITSRFGILLGELQLHVLFNSEGGYAQAPNKAVSVLAKMAYLLDEMSGNVLEPIRRADPFNLVPAK